MKKLLYGTTALAAVGMMAGTASAADKIKLGVGGYFQAFIVGASEEGSAGEAAANRRGHKVAREAEVIFNGKTTLDNGIQFGVQVQLEAEVCGDQIDETFMWASGGFGRINIGSENSAAYLMHYKSPAPSGWSHGLNSPNFSHAQSGGNAVGKFPHSNPVSLTSDSEKITYFTPRMSGFQLGVSYTPENCEETNTQGARIACGGSYGGMQSDNTGHDEVVEIGANYVGKISGAKVAVSGSWGETNNGVAGGEDRDEWSLGASVTASGFTVGAGYRNLDQGTGANNDENTDFNIGVRYATGPWGVGVQYANAQREVSGGTGEDELDAFEFGGSYNLGPGVQLQAGIQHWDYEDAGNAVVQENQATIFFVGTYLSF